MKHFFFITLFAAVAFTASASSVYLTTFENLTNPKGEFFVDEANFAPITLVDNPKKEGINTSAKVAAVHVYPEGVGVNSGIIKINFADGVSPKINYPVNPLGEGDDIPVYYDKLRFKYYKGNRMNKNVELEPNGQATDPKSLKTAESGVDEWEYITFDLINKSYQNFQIRVNRNEAGSGSAVGTQEGELIYVDDFELYNSEAGPSDPSAIKLTLVNNKFTCVNTGDRAFRLDTMLEKASDIQVELISMDGRAETIYRGVNSGRLEVPFTVAATGIYAVRMIIDNKEMAVEKIIAR